MHAGNSLSVSAGVVPWRKLPGCGLSLGLTEMQREDKVGIGVSFVKGAGYMNHGIVDAGMGTDCLAF